jgi:hypothetical protein
MSIDKSLHKVEQSDIPRIHSDIIRGFKELDEIDKQLMEVRIKIAKSSKYSNIQ